MIYIIYYNQMKVKFMKIKDFLGSTVLDKNAYEVGKVGDIDFNTDDGKIEKITLTLQKNLFSKDELEIEFADIATIGAYVIFNKEIPKADEKVEATIEIEEDEDE